MAKKFSDNNPLKNLSETTPPEPSLKKEALSNPEPAKTTDIGAAKEKRKPKYLRLDITDYQDYVSLMADHQKVTSGKYVSMTQYILRLIEADKQKNLELFRKLEEIENMKKSVT